MAYVSKIENNKRNECYRSVASEHPTRGMLAGFEISRTGCLFIGTYTDRFSLSLCTHSYEQPLYLLFLLPEGFQLTLIQCADQLLVLLAVSTIVEDAHYPSTFQSPTIFPLYTDKQNTIARTGLIPSVH